MRARTAHDHRRTGIALGTLLSFLVVLLLAGCSTASTYVAQCGVITGDGSNGHDLNVHKFIFPGQKVDYDSSTEKVSFFPCGDRNYIINDGTVKNANGQQVGDRFTPVTVWTKDTYNSQTKQGHPPIRLNVWLRADWTPNENPDAMTAFYLLCLKYKDCLTTDANKAGDVNSSTTGWNSMLGENFGPTIDTSSRLAFSGTTITENGKQIQLAGFDESVVRDPSQWIRLGNQISQIFMDNVRRVHGSSLDLFCGSGNSSWPNPQNPGKGTYTCTDVRFTINFVEKADPEARKVDDAAARVEAQMQLNLKQVATAQQKYGDQWAYWLGVQDTIAACNAAQRTTCVIDFGGNKVTVPVSPTSASTTK